MTAEEAGLPSTLRKTDKNNFSPRVGVAWRPFGDTRTVIRGGVGLYTVPLLGSVNYSMAATVTAAAIAFANTATNPFVLPNISSSSSAQTSVPVGTLDFRRANQTDMRDRRFASGIGRGLDLLVGGWDVTGITLFQSGPFLTPVFSNGDPSGTGTTVRGWVSAQRPDQIADGNLSNPTADAFFDANAFVKPADNIGRFGNAEVGSLVGPGTKVFSMTVGKSVLMTGTSRLRVELAFANLFNIENFDVPNTNITSSAFGRVTDTRSVDQAGPRTVQLSLRYAF